MADRVSNRDIMVSMLGTVETSTEKETGKKLGLRFDAGTAEILAEVDGMRVGHVQTVDRAIHELKFTKDSKGTEVARKAADQSPEVLAAYNRLLKRIVPE